MKCPHCDHENPIHQQYCASCGRKIEVEFSKVADSVRDDAARIQARRLPVSLAQAVALMLLANVACFIVAQRLSREIRTESLPVPAVFPPPISLEMPVEAPMPRLPGPTELTPLPLPAGAERSPERLGFRRDPVRSRLHAARGGTPEGLQAIERGLACLAKRQRPSGEWQVTGGWYFGKIPWGAPGMTGLAVLALLGDGHVWTDAADPLGESAGKGVRYLLTIQDESGRIGSDKGNYMYNHGIATAALCEAYAMGGMPSLRAPAKKAVEFLLGAQRSSGGWGYTAAAGDDATISVSAWQIAALRSARLAGLEVPAATLQAAARYLDSLTDPDTGEAGYNARPAGAPDGSPDLTHTAISLACRTALGQPVNGGLANRHRQLLLLPAHLPVWLPAWDTSIEGRIAERVYYYFYHGAMGLRADESPGWRSWYDAASRALISKQSQDGSWPIVGKWALQGGRAYATALAVLTLESTYRYP